MEDMNQLQIELTPYHKSTINDEFNLNRIICDLDSQIELVSSKADTSDYLISIGSGLLCGMLDILWVGSFNLEDARDFSSKKIDNFVIKTAKLLGCKDDNPKNAVKFLEKKFPIPSDGNTPEFGGGLQHHLRDFSHHPTIAGLFFSLLTQFTQKSYGTNTAGNFIIVDIPAASKAFIGKDTPTKVFYGTVIWFFHLVSDMAGSSSSIGNGGGTGIPGPLLSLAKELSSLPIFKSISVKDNSLSVFLSKLFNGTFLAQHDKSGRILKDTKLRFDLRTELGIGIQLGRQALPVIANECFVRCFYFIRRFMLELKENKIRSFSDILHFDWSKIKPSNNPTIDRMLTIATGVFTTIDIGEAVVSGKYWVSVNYIGVGRFAVAISDDISWCLKARNLKKIKSMYEDIKRFLYTQENERVYERMGFNMDKLGLTTEQTELLYNLEYHKTANDIQTTKLPFNTNGIKHLKQSWLDEWKEYISKGFSSFLQIDGAEIHWYTEQELIAKIEENQPEKIWFRLVLLETLLFEPYYPLSLDKDNKGNPVPSKKYSALKNSVCGYKQGVGDDYLNSLFTGNYYSTDFIKRLRKCHSKMLRELNETLKTAITSLTITAIVSIAAVATAGTFAPAIAVALVGSNFAGLSGAALSSACLAYLGGGAIAVGGAGMFGGTMVIVGGGTALGLGIGASVGGTVGAVSLLGKKNTIMQSAKLLVTVREIFLNDEHDTAYSNSIYEQYIQNILDIEKELVELKMQADVANSKDKKELKAKIKKIEDSVDVMKIARKNWAKFSSSFEDGLSEE